MMKNRTLRAVAAIAAGGTVERLPEDEVNASDEQYLAAATDHTDLERRMRVLERGNSAPLFVTFNH